MKVKIGKYPKNPSRDRKISIEITDDDTFSLDHTLALIIHPALVKIKEKFVQYPSHPGSLSSAQEWLEIIDCMIFSFEKVINNDYWDEDKIQKGFDLFGKYYQNLWW
jgi:hypothetical protein